MSGGCIFKSKAAHLNSHVTNHKSVSILQLGKEHGQGHILFHKGSTSEDSLLEQPKTLICNWKLITFVLSGVKTSETIKQK